MHHSASMCKVFSHIQIPHRIIHFCLFHIERHTRLEQYERKGTYTLASRSIPAAIECNREASCLLWIQGLHYHASWNNMPLDHITIGLHLHTFHGLLRFVVVWIQFINSLVPERFEWNLRNQFSTLILLIDGWCISCKIALKWLSQGFTDKKTLVQVMTWCRHYLSQCWHRSTVLSLI